MGKVINDVLVVRTVAVNGDNAGQLTSLSSKVLKIKVLSVGWFKRLALPFIFLNVIFKL
jgi:hypothetical protein